MHHVSLAFGRIHTDAKKKTYSAVLRKMRAQQKVEVSTSVSSLQCIPSQIGDVAMYLHSLFRRSTIYKTVSGDKSFVPILVFRSDNGVGNLSLLACWAFLHVLHGPFLGGGERTHPKSKVDSVQL